MAKYVISGVKAGAVAAVVNVVLTALAAISALLIAMNPANVIFAFPIILLMCAFWVILSPLLAGALAARFAKAEIEGLKGAGIAGCVGGVSYGLIATALLGLFYVLAISLGASRYGSSLPWIAVGSIINSLIIGIFSTLAGAIFGAVSGIFYSAIFLKSNARRPKR